VARDTDSIVFAAVVAHDMGAPVIKVPVPAVAAGAERSGPWPAWWPASACRSSFSAGPSGTPDGPGCSTRSATVMEGGGSGMAIGRAVYQDPDPAEMAGLVAELGAPMMILTIDFGTTVTKVGLWSEDGLVALTRAVLTTAHTAGRLGRAGPVALVDIGGHRLCRVAGARARRVRPGRCRRVLGRAADLRAGERLR